MTLPESHHSHTFLFFFISQNVAICPKTFSNSIAR